MARFFAVVSSAILAASLWSQTPASQVTAQFRNDGAAQALPDHQVIVLDPLSSFENIKDETVPPAYAGANSAFETRLLSTARNEVKLRKLGIVQPDTLSDPAATDSCQLLQSMSSRLARGNITDEAKEILNRLAAIDDRHVILAQFIRVKLGPGGSWEPMSGAITSQMNSTLLQAALVSCKTGQVLWRNEVLIRKILKADSPEFIKALGLLYQTFTIK